MGPRWIVGCLVGCLVATTTMVLADAPPRPVPVKRKPASLAYPPEALSAFVAGVIADKAGNGHHAEDHYRRSLRASAQASTAYNLANLQHRRENYSQAIESYRKYLELAPEARDRREVERLIQTLEQRPSVAVIGGREPGAIVLVDGKLVGPSPALIYPAEGRHVVDRIAPRSYQHRAFYVTSRPRTHHLDLGYEEREGNVVVSASPDITWRGSGNVDGHAVTFPGRFTLPPGRHELRLPAREFACEPIVIDVAKGRHITYVYIDHVARGRWEGGCRPVVVRTQKIELPS